MRKEGARNTEILVHSCTYNPNTGFKMKLLLVLVMLIAEAAGLEDLTGRMFTFPVQNNRARVKMNTDKKEFTVATVCFRSFTDLKRDHILFSMATPANSNAFLIFWDEANKELEAHIVDQKSEFRGLDYKPNMWHSVCTTWVSETGLVQLWFDGKPSMKKILSTGLGIRGDAIIIVGQEQDSHGGGFDSRQSFVGMMTDIHMWDYVLSACEIHNYVDELNFTPGNVLNWRALDYEIIDKVIVEEKFSECH